MLKNWKRVLKHMIILLAGSALLGTLLLVFVFMIPTDRIRQHVAGSVDSMLPDDADLPDNAFLRHVIKNKEGYTDSIIVQYAFERIAGKNAFEHAMWAYHHDLEEEIWAAEDSLRAVLNDTDPAQMHLREYSRYWHGYLLYIKPLLLIFSWEQLIWIELLLQVALFAAVVIIAARKGQAGAALAMTGGLLLMKPELMVASFTMSVCFLITLAAVLVLLCRGNWLYEKQFFPEFFLCIGILTAYFDFLTYPVVTLGFPLCVCFLMFPGERLWNRIGRLVEYGFCWSVGYAGMWASKWIIADAALHTGTIRDAVWNVIGRTEAIGGRPRMNGGFYVISLNFKEYDTEVYAVILAVLILLTICSVIWALFKGVSWKKLLAGSVPFVLTGVIPFAWIVVVQHHSALHARFTFRILGVAVMALCCIGVQAFRMAKDEKIQKN